MQYYLAKAHTEIKDMESRYDHLRKAKTSYESFIQECLRSKVVKASEIGYDEDEEYDEVRDIPILL